MGPEQALAATKDYGLIAVVMILLAFFLGWLVVYVLRQNREREKSMMMQNEEREKRLAGLIEIHITGMETKQNERHLQNRESIAELKEAAKRGREEHEMFLKNQQVFINESTKVTNLLDKMLTKMGAL